MVLFDSSVVIALFREEDAHHAKAKEVFLEHEKIMISYEVLSEALSILKMKCGLKVAKDCLYFLQNAAGIFILGIYEEIFHKSAQYFFEHKNNMSFTDTALLLYATQKKMPLITFDKELHKAVSMT